MIRVAVAGAAGRMGATVCEAVEGAEDMELVARADPGPGHVAGGGAVGGARTCSSTSPSPTTALANAREAVAAGIHVVIGTTGFDVAELDDLRGAKANVFVAPNFAIGAVLMMQFAVEAARHMARGRDHRAAPRRQGRHAQRDRGADGGADARTPAARDVPDPLRAAARPGRPPGGDPRRRGTDADDPPRLDRPRVVHARRAAGRAAGGRPQRVSDGRARAACLRTARAQRPRRSRPSRQPRSAVEIAARASPTYQSATSSRGTSGLLQPPVGQRLAGADDRLGHALGRGRSRPAPRRAVTLALEHAPDLVHDLGTQLATCSASGRRALSSRKSTVQPSLCSSTKARNSLITARRRAGWGPIPSARSAATRRWTSSPPVRSM